MTGLRALAVFGTAFLCGVAGIIALALFLNAPAEPRQAASPRTPVVLQALSEGLFVAPQIDPWDMDEVMGRGIRTVIDLRPDGEAEGQPDSALIGQLARNRTMRFAYVPIPHGEVPDAVVDRLAAVLAQNPGPILLYCRSGKRAARTWALAEAARPDGLSPEAIEARVIAVGQPIDDLSNRLRIRAARRAASQ